MKLISTAILFAFAWSFLAMAQVPNAAPVAAVQSVAPVAVVAPVVVAPSGIMEWVTAHGGFQSAILLLVGAALSLLSALRQVLAIFDGVAPGAPIPEGMAGLTTVNKICIILGKIVDFLTGNIAH